MRQLSMFVFLIAVCGLNLSFAQTPDVGSVERLDPALDAIVSSDATVEVLKGDYFGNAEGHCGSMMAHLGTCCSAISVRTSFTNGSLLGSCPCTLSALV